MKDLEVWGNTLVAFSEYMCKGSLGMLKHTQLKNLWSIILKKNVCMYIYIKRITLST